MSLPVDPEKYALFIGVMALTAITPGPANLFAIATGLQRGRSAGFVGVLGMNTATLVWFGGAALGLGALVAAFPEQFRFIAIAGAAYVGWLGLKALWSARSEQKTDFAVAAPARAGAAFRDGFAVQLANPKAILFFTAVLPPFIDPARPIVAQMAAFAVVAIALDTVAMTSYAFAGAALSARMQDPGFRRLFSAFVGALLLTTAALIVATH
jgi:threonine/homoserine/homoserine lactone efflux protein